MGIVYLRPRKLSPSLPRCLFSLVCWFWSVYPHRISGGAFVALRSAEKTKKLQLVDFTSAAVVIMLVLLVER